ncbi:general transcription and DNA repair factor IIH subunit TFB2 [Selaginella moellendorffii]|uniref:general transcription and DNA repair factor IIH subunit TFB2 n=1 Tax=Selaginella moellendorffii TaxID=88036 RepID=UPI000D1D0C46|nr:general transcription and DNA repair factor IIH subunit TFB2 [Selaginella moellendorffii]XP_024545637.1 general transcription and DNA repair factor IIH subunit TFB2 [Selaginella moellendorffii]|eukprot:XP_024515556.1 general transcription and DNA repair factor IIH subunit TFB2 [Selaginella moellendorffii]
MPNVRRATRDFMDLVASCLTAARIDALYASKWTCQAVLRSLPPLAKLYVLRLLYLDAAVPDKMLLEWIKGDAVAKHKNAVDRLVQLRVFLPEEKKKETHYRVNPKFQEQLRLALSTGLGTPRDPLPPDIAVRMPSAKELDDYATEKWESVVLQLVNFASPDGPSASTNGFIVQLFQKADLLTSGQDPKITPAGFQFLLLDRNSQLWRVIREYVQYAEARQIDTGELIRFLLEIGFYSVGEPYSMDSLPNSQRNFAEELAMLGVLQLQKGMKDRWFIPTRLATGLSASLSESSAWQTEGFIMVETNFRVYAYTSSKLHIETLHVFVRTEYVLPNILVGSITKESVNGAFASGISADQIIKFLQQHAHPFVAQKVPSVPETVCDQIRLWESDRVRVQYLPAYCYEGFPSTSVYESVVAHARDRNGLLWEDANRKMIVVGGEHHEAIRAFLQNINKKK